MADSGKNEETLIQELVATVGEKKIVVKNTPNKRLPGPICIPAVHSNNDDEDFDYAVHYGGHNSLFVHVLHDLVDADMFRTMVNRLENGPWKSLWIGIPERFSFTMLLAEQWFKCHCSHDDGSLFGRRVYVKTLQDDVTIPTYATAFGGAGLLIRSADGEKVLFGHSKKWSRWGRIGGTLDLGEDHFECALREAFEEVSILVDGSMPLRQVMVTSTANQKDKLCDTFIYYSAYVSECAQEPECDEKELDDAKYFDVSTCCAVLEAACPDLEKDPDALVRVELPKNKWTLLVGKDEVGVEELCAIYKMQNPRFRGVPFFNGSMLYY